MTGTGIIARAALMGAAVVLGSSAWADILVFDLDQANIPFTGPYIEVTVDRTSSTTATFTFDSLTNGGNTYLMHSNGAAAVNINGTFTLDSFSASNSLPGFSTPVPSNGGSGTEDGFGSFNQTISLFDGFNSPNGGAANEIVFSVTLTSGTWASAANVLTPNGSGQVAAAQIGACPAPCTGSSAFLTPTGFASGFAPVPAPIVGAGLPGVVLACGGLLALARRRRQLVA